MLTIHTGSNHLLMDELCRITASLPAENDIFIVVPRQLTLLTEQTVMHTLNIKGTFHIQVFNTTRICSLIFNEAGFPEGDTIDDRGRVMLCRRAARNVRERLSIYRDAVKRNGFAEKCAKQMEALLQGGVSAERLFETSEKASGADAAKLRDLSFIMEEYTALTEGLYRDTESDLIDASFKAKNAPFIRNSCFVFFGFAIMPPNLVDFIASVSEHAVSSHLLFPLDSDSAAPACNLPIKKTLDRLIEACRDRGITVDRAVVNKNCESDPASYFADQLYSENPSAFSGDHSNIMSFTTRTIREECRAAAAVARSISREKGIRYGEMQILCSDPELYLLPLREAFETYSVPLMADTGRPVSHVGAAEHLLFALRCISDNYRLHDVISLARTGFSDITASEADMLENYAVQRGIEGARWHQPFIHGENKNPSEEEPIRAKLIVPLKKLHDSLSSAEKLKAQLCALFDYLSDARVDSFNFCRKTCDRLIKAGRTEDAGLISQSWNRLLSTLDMMHELLGSERLSLNELYQTLNNALNVSRIKVLPQSSDCVYMQSSGTLLQQRPRVIFAMGMCERSCAVNSDMLLLPSQQKMICSSLGTYLGPDEEDSPLLKRYFMKESLAMASDMLIISCSMVDFDGAPHKRGEEFKALTDVFPDHHDIPHDKLDSFLLGAYEPAFEYASYAYGPDSTSKNRIAKRSLESIAVSSNETSVLLEQLDFLSHGMDRHENIDPAKAQDLYKHLNEISVSQLECYAQCPFKHFLRFGLIPSVIKPFELTAADSGTFLHECLHEFFISYKDRMDTLSCDDASRQMEIIARSKLAETEKASELIKNSSVSSQLFEDLIDRACNCASVLTAHMKNSRFIITDSEMKFDASSDHSSIPGMDVCMKGSIDRVDCWNDGKRTRIIDFKSSDRSPDPAAMLDGSELQLAVYMAIANESYDSKCAGMYYFPLLDGIVSEDTINPVIIERIRSDNMRMNGILPADPEIIQAQTDTPESVFSAFSENGKCKKNAPIASDEDFKRIISHTSKKVTEHLLNIRSGKADILPLRNKKNTPCTYCENRSACLFDPSYDKKRSISKVKDWEEFFRILAVNDDQ